MVDKKHYQWIGYSPTAVARWFDKHVLTIMHLCQSSSLMKRMVWKSARQHCLSCVDAWHRPNCAMFNPTKNSGWDAIAEIAPIHKRSSWWICKHFLVGGFNHLENISQIGNLPQVGVKIKQYLSCHHPVLVPQTCHQTPTLQSLMHLNLTH